MNKKILAGFGLCLVALLVLPVVAQMYRATREAPRIDENTLAAMKEQESPRLSEQNLVGTGWRVKTPDIPVAVTIRLYADGRAVATVPPALAAVARQMLGVDTLNGSWSVQGAQVIASVEHQGKQYTVVCDIVGDRLFYQNTEIVREF